MIKHDGGRLIGRKRDKRVRLATRGADWTEQCPPERPRLLAMTRREGPHMNRLRKQVTIAPQSAEPAT